MANVLIIHKPKFMMPKENLMQKTLTKFDLNIRKFQIRLSGAAKAPYPVVAAYLIVFPNFQLGDSLHWIPF